MWPFKRRRPPSKWDALVHDCDLNLARNEIADAFATMQAEGEREGVYYATKQELADAWESFATNPCTDTAIAFLEGWPIFARYFEACRPGGKFYEYHRFRRS